MKPAIFLDRDGTINVEKNYLYRVMDWEWIAGAPEAVTMLNRAGYLVVVVTNQAGVARGLYNEQDIQKLHAFVSKELAKYGAKIDAYYYCPHHPSFDSVCSCRKPAAGMIMRAAADLNIDLSLSWLVGDKLTDIQAGEAANIRTVLVRTGYGTQEEANKPDSTIIADNIYDAVEIIVKYTNPMFAM